MTLVENYHFEIVRPGALSGVVFGAGNDITVEDFDPGAAVWRLEAMSNPVADGFMFGKDRRDGPTWTFALSTDRSTDVEALDSLAELASAWSGDSVRGKAGAVMEMRYMLADRVRSVFGRPRDWAPAPTSRMMSGYLPTLATFQLAHYLAFGAEERVSLSVVPDTVGGLLAPLESPLSTESVGGQRAGQFTVQGEAATPHVAVRFDGPVTNPKLTIGGWTAALDGTVPLGASVTLDARPWARSVLWESGKSAGGMVNRRTRLTNMLLSPGGREAIFTGEDATGTGRATLSWRPAYRSL